VRIKDITGQTFGKLTVIKRAGHNRSGAMMWLCECSCGGKKVINGVYLRNGHTRSCGCLNKFQPGLGNMRALISNYKAKAKARGHDWELTEKQFREITQKDCYYCGMRPNQIHRAKNHNGNYVYNGIDRVDNSKGYTIDNVVSCCKICNRAKGDLTIQEFKSWVERISKFKLKVKDFGKE